MRRDASWVIGTLTLASWVAVAGAGAADAEEPEAVTVEVAAEGVTQALELRDGSRLFGRVEEVDEDRVVFHTLSGARVEVARGEILAVREVRGHARAGEFFPEDPNRTRLFFGPTARSLPRGRGYAGVYELVVPFVQLGVTDRITVGGGTPLIFGESFDDRPFWFTPKVQLIRGERTQAAAGVMHLVFAGDEKPVGIAYGVVTHGTGDASLTVGAGYAYESTDSGAWVGMVGGDVRVGRGLKLLGEGYLLPGGDGLVMAGLRLFGSRLSADLGLLTAVGDGEALAIPIVNVVWTF